MNQPTPQLTEIKDRAARTKLQKLLHERECLSYSFSYKALVRALTALATEGGDEETIINLIGQCIVATTEDELKGIKKSLNDEISTIMLDNDLTAVRSEDPWDRKMDCVIYTHPGSSRFNATRAIEIWPSKYKISPAKAQEMIEAATVAGKEYTVVAVTPVREKETK